MGNKFHSFVLYCDFLETNKYRNKPFCDTVLNTLSIFSCFTIGLFYETHTLGYEGFSLSPDIISKPGADQTNTLNIQ